MKMRLTQLFGLTLVGCLFSIQLHSQVNSAVAADSLSNKVTQLKADSIPWKYKGLIGAGFNAVQLNNWMGGGTNAITIRGLFLGSLNYAEERFSWENNLDLGYSLTKLGVQDFRKADDRIVFGSKASLRQNDWMRYTAFLDFRTQFYNGYNYDVKDSTSSNGFLKISNLLAPAYLTGSLGAEFTPIKQFKLLVAPIASRTIFVMDDDLAATGAFGVNPGENIKNDIGCVISSTVDVEIVENVTWRNRLNLFGRYNALSYWVVTDENAILMKVNDFLSVGILTDIFYDHKVPVVRDDGTTGPATQVRNQLVIDFRYQFANFQ